LRQRSNQLSAGLLTVYRSLLSNTTQAYTKPWHKNRLRTSWPVSASSSRVHSTFTQFNSASYSQRELELQEFPLRVRGLSWPGTVTYTYPATRALQYCKKLWNNCENKREGFLPSELHTRQLTVSDLFKGICSRLFRLIWSTSRSTTSCIEKLCTIVFVKKRRQLSTNFDNFYARQTSDDRPSLGSLRRSYIWPPYCERNAILFTRDSRNCYSAS